jgi:peroxiredoxin
MWPYSARFSWHPKDVRVEARPSWSVEASTIEVRDVNDTTRYSVENGCLEIHLHRPVGPAREHRLIVLDGSSFRSLREGVIRALIWRASRSRCIERSLTMRSDLTPGVVFPDYQLPDHTSTLRRLSELQGDDPLILTLSRGHYCPKEHQQHLELAAFYPKIAVAYTQIATISTDDHHTLQEFRESVGAQWTFLSDPGRTVQKDLDIAEYTDPEHNPMIPHTLVLKPGLVIHRIYNGYWFWGRPSVNDLWHDLRAVTSEIRPDWDLSTPGLREAWSAGDLSAFHGWNKGAKAVPVGPK